MEFPKPSVVSALILLIHVMAAVPGIALKLEPAATRSHIAPILDCAPANSADNHSAFRGNVLALLGALPAAVATPPTGFTVAATQSSGSAVGDDRVFAFGRAFCFGSVVPDACLECLSTAAQDVADGCHGRRGAVWRAGCFLSYADTNASTAREDGWRGWFYDDDDDSDGTRTAALATCVGTGIGRAECARCLNESAQVVPALREGRQLSLFHRDAVVVVGYSCYLRVPLFAETTLWVESAVFDVVLVVLIEIVGILFCFRIARQFNPAA